MPTNDYICVLSIAGSDPSGGAGIQADIKAISATGAYAAAVITALTAQNTQGVQAIHEIPAQFVEQQIVSIFDDVNVSAVKMGMLHSEKIIKVVCSTLIKYKPNFIVLDPVMVAKDGGELLQKNTLDFLKQNLFPLATLITPNLFEAEQIIAARISTCAEQEKAAIQMGKQFGINVLLKGGHLQSDQAADVLYLQEENTCHWFYADRIVTQHTHGTGCSLAAAIASYLAQSYSLVDAIQAAKQYLTKAIYSGATRKLGQGSGPVDHFYFLEEMTR